VRAKIENPTDPHHLSLVYGSRTNAKSAPILTNEPECTDCSTFLGELTVLKEKYATKVEELDVLRVELDEMKSRPALLALPVLFCMRS
jgi:hypothetical protein